jgi:ribosomal-protein-alanine N-acetyltransferase
MDGCSWRIKSDKLNLIRNVGVVFVMILEGSRVFIRTLQVDDANNLVKLIKNNKDFWADTEPRRSDSYYKVEVQREMIKRSLVAMKNGTGYAFGIFSRKTGQLIGDISLYEIRKAPFQSAIVGYSMDKSEVGKGYATDSLKLALSFAFGQLALHRVTAGVMPRNHASIRVLEKSGFQKEGLSRENICINGTWENHLQYSILRHEWINRRKVF